MTAPLTNSLEMELKKQANGSFEGNYFQIEDGNRQKSTWKLTMFSNDTCLQIYSHNLQEILASGTFKFLGLEFNMSESLFGGAKKEDGIVKCDCMIVPLTDEFFQWAQGQDSIKVHVDLRVYSMK